MSRFSELVRSIPIGTFILLSVNISLHVIAYLVGVEVMDVAINAYFVVNKFEFYRLVTSSFFHGGLMHLAFNMMSTFAMAASLERFFGTLRFLYLTALTVLVANTLYVAACEALAAITGDVSWIVYTSVGFSGVLFAYAMLESALSPHPTRNLCGCNVPTRLYPWVILVLIQVVMPNISLLGHLTGLLVGVAIAAGWLSRVVPAPATFRAWDAAPSCARLAAAPSFVPCPDADLDANAAAAALAVFSCIPCCRPGTSPAGGRAGDRGSDLERGRAGPAGVPSRTAPSARPSAPPEVEMAQRGGAAHPTPAAGPARTALTLEERRARAARAGAAATARLRQAQAQAGGAQAGGAGAGAGAGTSAEAGEGGGDGEAAEEEDAAGLAPEEAARRRVRREARARELAAIRQKERDAKRRKAIAAGAAGGPVDLGVERRRAAYLAHKAKLEAEGQAATGEVDDVDGQHRPRNPLSRLAVAVSGRPGYSRVAGEDDEDDSRVGE